MTLYWSLVWYAPIWLRENYFLSRPQNTESTRAPKTAQNIFLSNLENLKATLNIILDTDTARKQYNIEINNHLQHRIHNGYLII